MPKIKVLPSPQTGSPSGVNQSTRQYPDAPPSISTRASPKSCKPGLSGLFIFATLAFFITALSVPVNCKNCSNWCEPMSHNIPPYSSRSKNQPGRTDFDSLCGARIRTCRTLPISPAFINSSAFSAASLWTRSAKYGIYLRPVSATSLRACNSCSSVVKGGLSTKKSFPARKTLSPMSHLCAGMPAFATSFTSGSLRIVSKLSATGTPGNFCKKASMRPLSVSQTHLHSAPTFIKPWVCA